MDANVSKHDPALIDEPAMQSADTLGEYGRMRRKRERRRKKIRGALGILFVLLLWQGMSIAYGLEQILPTPIAVATQHLRDADAELQPPMALWS